MKSFEEFMNEAKDQYLVTAKQGGKVTKQSRLTGDATRKLLMAAFSQTRGSDSASLQVPQLLRDLDAGKRETIGLDYQGNQLVIQKV